MPENKDCFTKLSLELTFHILMQQQANELGLTNSGYMRKLLIEELQRRNLLTEQLLARVTTMSPREIDRMFAEAAS